MFRWQVQMPLQLIQDKEESFEYSKSKTLVHFNLLTVEMFWFQMKSSILGLIIIGQSGKHRRRNPRTKLRKEGNQSQLPLLKKHPESEEFECETNFFELNGQDELILAWSWLKTMFLREVILKISLLSLFPARSNLLVVACSKSYWSANMILP